MNKILKRLGYLRPSGRVDWGEVRFDTIIIIFLFIIGIAIGANL